MSNKINTYTCPNGHVTVTIRLDEGVTPFALRCHQKLNEKHNCTEFAKSAFYQCDQSLNPEYEWFKPTDIKKVAKGLREHVKQGGLVLRKHILSKKQVDDILDELKEKVKKQAND